MVDMSVCRIAQGALLAGIHSKAFTAVFSTLPCIDGIIMFDIFHEVKSSKASFSVTQLPFLTSPHTKLYTLLYIRKR